MKPFIFMLLVIFAFNSCALDRPADPSPMVIEGPIVPDIPPRKLQQMKEDIRHRKLIRDKLRAIEDALDDAKEKVKKGDD